MLKARKLLLTVLVVGLAGILVGFGTFSAFSSTTSNSGNNFSAGTVQIDDNDAAGVMYNVTNKKPLDSVQSCIKVTYTGSLDADVKLYASAIAAVGQYIDLTVTPGTGNVAFGSTCTNFTPAAGGAIYTGTLKNFADTYNNWGTGLATNPSGATKWVTNDAVVYKFVLTLQDNNGANGGTSALSTGNHSFTWEARNQ